MIKNCVHCGATENVTEHIDKVPKKQQARFGKTSTWYSTDHRCPKIQGFSEMNKVLQGLLSK